jgi:hypothetical protein
VPASEQQRTRGVYAQRIPSPSQSIDFNAVCGRHGKITPACPEIFTRKPCRRGLFSRADNIFNSREFRQAARFCSHQVLLDSVPRRLLQPSVAPRHRPSPAGVEQIADSACCGDCRSSSYARIVVIPRPIHPWQLLGRRGQRRRIAAPHIHILTCLLLPLPPMYVVVISCWSPQ